MENALKYIVDEKGHKSSVLIPIEQWDDINKKYNKLLNKIRVMTSIKNGLEEVHTAKKSGKKLQTLKDFLNESRR